MTDYFVNKYGDPSTGYYYYGDNLATIETSTSFKANSTSAPGVDGEYSTGTQYGPKDLTLEGLLAPPSSANLDDPQLVIDLWDAFLVGHRPGPARRLYVNSDWYLLGEVRNIIQAKTNYGPWVAWSAQLHCPKPYWYSDTIYSQVIPASGAVQSVDAHGTLDALPILQFTVTSSDGVGSYKIVDSYGNLLQITPASGQNGAWSVDCESFKVLYQGAPASGAMSGKFLSIAAGGGGSLMASVTSGVSGSSVSALWHGRKY